MSSGLTLRMIQTLEDDTRESQSGKTSPEDRPPKILCVDDDPEVLETLKEYFTHQGFQVLTATNGVEALFQVARRAPRAVILDLFMRRPGGLVALDRIKALNPTLPIILISGVPNVVEMVMEAGVKVAGAFRKPVDLAEISETLEKAGVVPQNSGRERTAARLFPEVGDPAQGRILVVDDDREIREVLVDYLCRKGFHASAVASGQEALRQLPELRPHIVLLDVVMPGLSGIETLRQIKDLTSETRVIMISGREEEEILRLTLALGAEDYVPKPVDFDYLDSVVDLHLEVGRFNA